MRAMEQSTAKTAAAIAGALLLIIMYRRMYQVIPAEKSISGTAPLCHTLKNSTSSVLRSLNPGHQKFGENGTIWGKFGGAEAAVV